MAKPKKKKQMFRAIIYSPDTVLEAAKKRIRWAFDEFENIMVGVSGGKDSTVVFELALEIAREKDRLPLKVMWLDQEMEWSATVDVVKEMMQHPDVEPYWFQIPFEMESAGSSEVSMKKLWDEDNEADWIRPKDKLAIHVNRLGEKDFYKVLGRIPDYYFPDQHTCTLTGVRCEESPVRFLGLTQDRTYKYITWGRRGGWRDSMPKDEQTPLNRNVALHPIYDWGFNDVWKAIHDHDWSYSPIYDEFYRYGVKRSGMRVSALIHEMAIRHMEHLQEIDKETYVKIVSRVAGTDSSSKLGAESRSGNHLSLPPVFGTWKQYRDFLLEKLISREDWRVLMANQFASHEKQFKDLIPEEKLMKVHLSAILTNDHSCIHIGNHSNSPNNVSLLKENNRTAADMKNLTEVQTKE